MAAYRRVDDLRHLQADCLYTGISSGPNARCRVWEAFTFTFTTRYRPLAGVCRTWPSDVQNRSLQTIRQKWFSLTTQKTSDTTELQSFLAGLDAFSPDLLKNVVNLADDNVCSYCFAFTLNVSTPVV